MQSGLSLTLILVDIDFLVSYTVVKMRCMELCYVVKYKMVLII